MTDVISLETVGIATTVINQGTVGPQGAVGAQGFPGLDGAAGLFVVSVSDSTTVAANSFLLADTSGTDAGATYTFPAFPQTGWRVRVLDVGGAVDTKPITVAGNGHDVADGGETRTISDPYRGESFVFEGNLDSWRLEEKVIFSHISATDNPHAVTKTQVGLGNVTDDAQVKRSEMGTANGVPTLGEDGLVPTNQLPPSDSGPWSNPIAATYLSPASCSVPTDRTEGFSAGVRVQANCGADGIQYGTVESSSYADPTTTVVLTMDAENALTANLVSVSHGNDSKLSLVNHAEQHALGGRDSLATLLSAMPAHFSRVNRLAAKTVSVAADRYTLDLANSWERLGINIGIAGFYSADLPALDLSVPATWDSTATDYTVAANRAGKDFYLYACNNSGALLLLLSANSTYPTGYSATTSRKIAGFHCLCAAAGVISGHPASGFLAGDIVPPSIWDLQWRPRCAPEGMRYVAGVWQDIYMPSVIGGALRPVYGGTMADGASTPVFDWYDCTEWLAREGKRLATQAEFMAGALGSNEGTNIAGSADPGTAGGHTDTAGRRMISATFGEDYCGVMWQWGIDPGAVPGTAAWKDQFVAARTTQRGQGYQEPTRAILGGDWSAGAYCGSRGSAWHYGPLSHAAGCGARGVAEPASISL